VINHIPLDQLQHTFPKLTEANQQYVLGLTEGLRYAQNKAGETSEKSLLRDRRQVKTTERRLIK
jgi:hypothetical protein